MIAVGVPAFLLKFFTYGKDIAFLILFLLSIFNMRYFDKLSILFLCFLSINFLYLFVNDLSMSVKLYALGHIFIWYQLF